MFFCYKARYEKVMYATVDFAIGYVQVKINALLTGKINK